MKACTKKATSHEGLHTEGYQPVTKACTPTSHDSLHPTGATRKAWQWRSSWETAVLHAAEMSTPLQCDAYTLAIAVATKSSAFSLGLLLGLNLFLSIVSEQFVMSSHRRAVCQDRDLASINHNLTGRHVAIFTLPSCLYPPKWWQDTTIFAEITQCLVRLHLPIMTKCLDVDLVLNRLTFELGDSSTRHKLQCTFLHFLQGPNMVGVVGESNLVSSHSMVHACLQQSLLNMAPLHVCLHQRIMLWHMLVLLCSFTFFRRVHFGQLPQLELVKWHMHFFFGMKQRLMHHDASCLCARDVLEYLVAMVFGIEIPSNSTNVRLQKKLCKKSKRNSFKRLQKNHTKMHLIGLWCVCFAEGPTQLCWQTTHCSPWCQLLERRDCSLHLCHALQVFCKLSSNLLQIFKPIWSSLPAFSLLRTCRQTLTHSRPKAPTVWLSVALEATYKAQASWRTCLRCWLPQVPKKKLTLQGGIKSKIANVSWPAALLQAPSASLQGFWLFLCRLWPKSWRHHPQLSVKTSLLPTSDAKEEGSGLRKGLHSHRELETTRTAGSHQGLARLQQEPAWLTSQKGLNL